MFERFMTRYAILKDNLTLLGYDLIFRSQQPGTGALPTPPAAYTIDAATMVFPWESLIGNKILPSWGSKRRNSLTAWRSFCPAAAIFPPVLPRAPSSSSPRKTSRTQATASH
jgi:hypothetical protein